MRASPRKASYRLAAGVTRGQRALRQRAQGAVVTAACMGLLRQRTGRSGEGLQPQPASQRKGEICGEGERWRCRGEIAAAGGCIAREERELF